MLNILFISDICGSTGRKCVDELLPGLKRELAVDLVVANGENAAHGVGLTPRLAEELFVSGVDVITTGNHVWRHPDLLPLLDDEPHLLRPANYPPSLPGHGWVIARTSSGSRVAVVNLQGRTFMNPIDCPFRAIDEIMEGEVAQADAVVIDFHAEATSEKQAFGWYVDGRVAAVVGTHTHVATADEKVLPDGTAYITDLGLTGPHASVIGMHRETAIARFLTQKPSRFQPAEGDPRLQGALVTIDPATGRAASIERIERTLD